MAVKSPIDFNQLLGLFNDKRKITQEYIFHTNVCLRLVIAQHNDALTETKQKNNRSHIKQLLESMMVPLFVNDYYYTTFIFIVLIHSNEKLLELIVGPMSQKEQNKYYEFFDYVCHQLDDIFTPKKSNIKNKTSLIHSFVEGCQQKWNTIQPQN